MNERKNTTVCPGVPGECHKCPHPSNMGEHQLHAAILKGQNEDCVATASEIYAKKIVQTIQQ